jgi:hypothetical protein
MTPPRRLIPYVLLGILTLGTGLGVALGLTEGPVTSTASSGEVMTTPCFAAPQGAGLSCHLRDGAVSFGFAGPELSKGAVNCLVSGVDGAGAPTSIGEVRRAVGLLLPECERASRVPVVPYVVQGERATA